MVFKHKKMKTKLTRETFGKIFNKYKLNACNSFVTVHTMV